MELVTSSDDLPLHPHPHPQPNPHHRKIDLQSPLDIAYLRANLLAAARQRLDLHFPLSHSQPQPQTSPPLVINLDGAGDSTPVSASASTVAQARQAEVGEKEKEDKEEEEDLLRAHVSSLVRQFIAQTFASAAHGISINGLDAATTELDAGNQTQAQTETEKETEKVEFEPYDPRLTAKVATLYAESERLSAQVAGLRRRAPREGAEGMGRRVRETVGKEVEGAAAPDEEDGDVAMGNVGDDGEGLTLDGVGVDVGVGGDDWQREVEAMYERGLDELAVLSGLHLDLDRGREGRIAGSGRGRGTGTARSQMSLTETVGKVQRAGAVVGELE